MLERRVIRVFAPFSRSLYFSDKGRERGLAAELIRDFEHYVNIKYAKELGKRPLTIYIGPATRDKLLPDVAEGLADIAIGNLTVTDERQKLVDFVALDEGRRTITEVIVTGPKSPQLATVDDLAGKNVQVRKSSSYAESLDALNARFRKEGKPEMTFTYMPESLEDEDMMEMLGTGLLSLMVVDDWKARMWAQVLPKIKVRDDLIVPRGCQDGLGHPQEQSEACCGDRRLLQELGHQAGRGRLSHEPVYEAHQGAQGPDDQRRLEAVPGDDCDLPEIRAAIRLRSAHARGQGYQESQLNQNAKSQVGAIGVMQIMPQTGADLKVGDIHITEPNIHAGAKYMDQLMTKYFPDAHFSEGNRPLFAFASYNCGPGNVAKARKEAEKARPRSRQVVQQRRDRRRREDRHRGRRRTYATSTSSTSRTS